MAKSLAVLPVAMSGLARMFALAGAASAYFARPWSCGLVLAKFSPLLDVPYRNFDRHGVGIMLAWLLAIVFALPTLWLAVRVLSQPIRADCDDPQNVGRATVVGSLGIALAIGLPSFYQITAWSRLPSSLTEPVIISATVWMTTTLGLLAMFVRRPDADEVAYAILGRAAALATFTAAPKLLVLGLQALASLEPMMY